MFNRETINFLSIFKLCYDFKKDLFNKTNVQKNIVVYIYVYIHYTRIYILQTYSAIVTTLNIHCI